MAKTIIETFCPECKKKMEVEIDLEKEKGRVPSLLQYGKWCVECIKSNPNDEWGYD